VTERLSIKHRLTLLPVMAGIGFFVCFAVGARIEHSNRIMVEELQEHAYPSLAWGRNLNQTLFHLQRHMQDAVAASDFDQYEAGEAEWDDLEQTIEMGGRLGYGSPERIAHLRVSAADYQKIAWETVPLMIEGSESEDLFDKLGTLTVQYNRISNEVASIAQAKEDEMDAVLESSRARVKQGLWGISGTTLLCLLFLSLASRRQVLAITRPLAALVAMADEVARGNYQTSVKVEAEDEIGRLGGVFNDMADSICYSMDQVRRKTEALNEAKQNAEAANHNKSAFLASMSHEIRTPLNGIIGMTELVLDGETTKDQADCLRIVQNSANALLEIINEILDFSKIESGHLVLEAVPFEVQEQIDDVIALLAPRAREKGLKFHVHVAPSVPRKVVGDKTRLRQVILNLLGNALKFTEKGEVRLEVKPASVQAPELLQFTVVDSGIGIAPDRIQDILKPFVQADSETTRRYGGTGLGLAISSQIANAMGGRLWVESEEGRGSTFHFTGRFAAAQEAESNVLERASAVCRGELDIGGRRILVAEDNLVNQKVAVRILAKLGHEAVVVPDGLQAVEILEKENIDLVLMDINMPVMDGLEATRKIRAAELGSDRYTPIIGLTALAMKGDAEIGLEAGMDHYLSKPFTSKQLAAALALVVEGAYCPLG